jgi:plasmid stability protein
MGVAITIRNVPEDVRDELAGRAARSGRSLQEYLREQLIETAARPSMDDFIRRAREHARAAGHTLSVESILNDLHADRR